MSVSTLNMFQTKGQMQAQDMELKQNQVTALNKSNMSDAEKEKKLREACEGFESIFIQKMWQQMRATLPQENPLVGREEKFWQSMYDQELSKKMASSGGIGLAEMMYDQLSKNLVSASRATADTVGKGRGFEVAATPLMPEKSMIADNSASITKSQGMPSANVATDIYDGAAPTTGNNPDMKAGAHVAQSHAPNNNQVGTQASASPNAPLVQQYLSNLMAKQSGQQVLANNTLTGPELARQAQLTATNQPPLHGVMPAQSSPIGGHALQAQNVFAQPGSVGATGAALLQSQIGGQPMENTQPHVIRTTYTTNIPPNEQSSRSKKTKQLLTSGQPMIRTLNVPTYAYGANQAKTEQAATSTQNTPSYNYAPNQATTGQQVSNIPNTQAGTTAPAQSGQNTAPVAGQVAQTTVQPNMQTPIIPLKTIDEG